MKKKFLSVLTAFMLMFSMTACGASSAGDKFAPQSSPMGNAAVEEMGFDESYVEEPMEEETKEEPNPTTGGSGALHENENALVPAELNLKLIWRASVTMETLDFDKTMESIRKTADELGGFVESSSSSGGSNARGNYRPKDASLTLRIPAKNLTGFLGKMEDCGTITYQDLSSENISLEYADTQARKDALKAEYDRLLELMAQAENIDTVIAIEARLSQVRLEMDSLSSRLRTFDNLVDYSTVYINVREVQHISNVDSPSFLQRIKNGLSDTMYSLETFFVDTVIFLIVNLPVFIVIAIVLVIVILLLKLIRKNSKNRKNRKEKKLETKKIQQTVSENDSNKISPEHPEK